MKTYRARIRMNTSYISKLQSDTVFGGLCWAFKTLFGDQQFGELLSRCRAEQPPFVASDIFPGDYLPKPMLPPAPVESVASKKALLASAREAKKMKSASWLTIDEFIRLAAGQRLLPPEAQPQAKTVVTLHNTVSRATGTTTEEGGLYELPETFCHEPYMSLYLKIEQGWEDKLFHSIELLGQFGVGKRRSVGKGGFAVEEFSPFDKFSTDDANAFISLSHFVPGPQDPVAGNYKTMVKYAKLDREFALQGARHPFKHPVVMLVPGSVFYTGGKPKEFYGRTIANVAPSLPEAIQGCYAFAVPARMEQGLPGKE